MNDAHTCLNRNASIDVFRVVLIFGICLLHSITQAGHCIRGLDNVLLCCVDGFVIISGFFGIKLRISKILSLLLTSLYVACVVIMIGRLLGLQVNLVNIYLKGYWFLWAYIVLMLLAPVIEHTTYGRGTLLFLVFGWSYMAKIPVIRDYSPCPNGFGDLTFFTLMGIYVVGTIIRKYEVQKFSNKVKALAFTIPLMAITAVGFGHYNSPFAVALAATLFVLFYNLNLGDRVAKAIAVIVPSVFSIYLFNANGVCYYIMRAMEDLFIDKFKLPYLGGWLLTAFLMFVLGFILDTPRRLMRRFLGNHFKRKMSALDSVFNRLCGLASFKAKIWLEKCFK